MNTQKINKKSNTIIWIADMLCVAYAIAFFTSMFFLDNTVVEKIFLEAFAHVNPFTTGVYVFGAAAIGTLLFSGNVFLKSLMVVFYLAITLVSLVASMGISSDIELIAFLLIRVLIAVSFVVIIVIQIRRKHPIT